MPIDVMAQLGRIFNMFGESGDAVINPPAALGDTPNEKKDPYADGAAIASEVMEHVREVDKLRWAFERLWFRSILYFLGNQWLTWDARSRRWREKKVRKWIPKPVTNRFASTASTIRSAIQSAKVDPSAWPATEDPEDIAAANVAERGLAIINNEIKVESVREQIAAWVTLNGDAFAFPHYDKKDRALGTTKVYALQCQACSTVSWPIEFEQAGGCPRCGVALEPLPTEEFKEYPIGKLKVDICSPLEVYLNLDLPDMSRQRKFTIARAYAVSTVKEWYPELADKIHPDSNSATRAAQYFMDALAYSTEDSGYNLTGSQVKDRVTLLHHVALPSEKYPEGLECVCTMDQITLEAGPSPYFEETKEGKQYYLPLIKFPYESVPGRLYAKTPMYDVISKQDQLNKLESLLEMASMKGVHTTWILPNGSSISNISGEPGQQVKWTPQGTGGAKPEAVTIAPFHAAMLQLKEGYERDFEELAGTFDALKGTTPKGVSAGYAIQLLTERSYGRFGAVFMGQESGWVELYTILLKLFKVYVTEDRLLKIKGSMGGWEIKAFKGADLKGNVDIRIEGGSAKPKSKIAEQALVESMAKIGVINPSDPEQGYEVARMFGISNILGVNDADARYAAGEWQALLDWNPPVDETGNPIIDPMSPMPFPPGGPMVDKVFDNHLVHMMEHRKPTRGDVYHTLPEWKKLYWQNHQLDHMMAVGPPPPPDGKSPLAGKPGTGSDSKVTSKANEKSDTTMDTLREGGNTTMGGGGSNQYQ